MPGFLSILFALLFGMQASSPTEKVKPLLLYKLRPPTVASEKPPVLILLHGVGSNEDDLFSVAPSLPGNYLVISARGPYTLGAGSYAWFHVDFSSGKPVIQADEAERSRKLLIDFVQQVKRLYKVNESRIYLGGFSQGGIMSYSVGLTRPDLLKGIVVLSSRLLPEVRPMVKPSERLKKLHLFVSHGLEDPVLSIEYAREAQTYLNTLGLTPEYHEYPGGHTLTDAMFRDLLAWLKKEG